MHAHVHTPPRHASSGGAAAHKGRATSNTDRARPPRCARRVEAAHTAAMIDTEAVLQALMSLLKADASENTCKSDDATVDGGAQCL